MGPLYAEMDTSIILDKVGKGGDLAKGGGRRIWSFNETPSSAKLKSETVQLLSGGDGIPVKPAYSKSQTLKPRQKCIVSTNHLPELGGAMTTALESRLMIIRFPVVFKDLDPGEAESKYVRRIDTSLKQSIEDKLPVILKWLVDGSVDWYKRRSNGRLLANAPIAIQEATKAYKDEHDTLGVFLSAKCILGPNLKMSTKELLEAYNSFHCKEIGTRELASLMQGKGFQKLNNVGKAKLNGYKGLKLYRPQ